jgi:hypothetical protein
MDGKSSRKTQADKKSQKKIQNEKRLRSRAYQRNGALLSIRQIKN